MNWVWKRVTAITVDGFISKMVPPMKTSNEVHYDKKVDLDSN